MKNLIIFSLISNKHVAKKVAQKLDAELGVVSFDFFADGEVLVKSESNVKGKDVLIIESTAKKAHERLFELLLLLDSVKRSGARSVKLYIPYFGYSRQERVSWYNEPVSCEVVAKILDTAKVDEILTFDLHHPDIEKFFETSFKNLPTTSLFANYYLKYMKKQGIKKEDIVVVSPDHGANSRADALCKEMGGVQKVILNKVRPKPNLAEHLEVDVKAVKGKVCIIIDDIIDTAGTIISAIDLLRKSGASKVLIGASHPVFSKNAVERLIAAKPDDIVVTNTIEKRLPKTINKLDISSLIKM